jgi:response regulator of citrate/malate metabolism
MTKRVHFGTVKDRNSYIVNQRQKGVTATELASEIGISECSVRRIYRVHRKTRSLNRKIGCGRPKTFTGPQKCRVSSIIK